MGCSFMSQSVPPNYISNIVPVIQLPHVVYTGKTEDGVPHGYGAARYTSGDKYEGWWNRGKKHGHGMHTFSIGNVYEGGGRKENFMVVG